MVSFSISFFLLRSLTVKVFCNALIVFSSVRWFRINCVFGLVLMFAIVSVTLFFFRRWSIILLTVNFLFFSV